MSAEDESLLTSPELRENHWTIPPELHSHLKPQSIYHWQIVVSRPDGSVERSDTAAFAIQ
jgi:hypothetical protein